MQTDESSRIPSMIEQRFRKDAKPIANDAAIELENLIITYLQKIGVSYTFLNLYSFIDQVRAKHTDTIVRARVNALVDSLTAHPVAAPVESITLSESDSDIAAGSWVKLKSGGPAMLVTSVDRWLATATCEWSDAWHVPPAQSHTFPIECLVLAPRSTIPNPQDR